MCLLTSFSLSPVLSNISSKVTLSAQAAHTIQSSEFRFGSGFFLRVNGIFDFLFTELSSFIASGYFGILNNVLRSTPDPSRFDATTFL